MEGALLAFAGKCGIDAASLDMPRQALIPFDSRQRFMATRHAQDTQSVVYVKGAPERLLSMCRTQRGPQGEEPLNVEFWRVQADAVASEGQRVLAFATCTLDAQHAGLSLADVEGTLCLLGMVGLIDPPRAEAIQAVAECHTAGIRVKMITGDHALTAAAIARQIGLQNPGTVLTGAELDILDDATLASAVLECDVFARTSPENKLRLVMALQSQGLTVAMTGDGVNDAPALKRADAGIAMGRKGSAAAWEAADLVLADDNFASIVAAVREGRTVYDNIRKLISWELPTNAGEGITIVVAILLGMSIPVTPVQILWVNLVTTIALGLTLARAGVADQLCLIAVSGGGVRHLFRGDRAGADRRAGPYAGRQHAGGAGDLQPLLHPQPLRHLADLAGTAGRARAVDGHHRCGAGTGGADLSAVHAGRFRHGAGAPG